MLAVLLSRISFTDVLTGSCNIPSLGSRSRLLSAKEEKRLSKLWQQSKKTILLVPETFALNEERGFRLHAV